MLDHSKTKLLLYCHNAVGLGHIMRTVQVAEALAEKPTVECTIITGCSYLQRIPINQKVRVEALPPVRRGPCMSFVTPEGEDGQARMDERGSRIEKFVRSYAPDVFLTDHAPFGLGGELVPMLTAARQEDWTTRFLWALRDIQFAPQHAASLGRPPANPTLKNAFAAYSGVLGYTDKDWLDPFEAYRSWLLPPQREYVGVVARIAPPRLTPEFPTIVCLSGGGAGAPQLFQLVLAAMRPLMHSNNLRLRFVAGPFGSADQIEVPNEFEEYIDLVAEASTDEAIRDASVVISRAGYNTSYALVQTELPLIFVPLPAPGDEQSYRAQKLARLLNVSAVDQTDPSVPELLRAALEQALNCEPSSRELPFRTDGAARTADFITALSSADGGTI